MNKDEQIAHLTLCLEEIANLSDLFYTIDCSTESWPNLRKLPPELNKYAGVLSCLFQTADYGLHPEKLEAMKNHWKGIENA